MKARKRTNQPFTLATTLLCFVLLSHAQDANKKDLHFSFITALTGSPLSSGGIPVIDFALEQINNDPRLLPNYNLKYTQVLDSKVTTALTHTLQETLHINYYDYSVTLQLLWKDSCNTLTVRQSPPTSPQCAVGVPPPPSLWLRSAITGMCLT